MILLIGSQLLKQQISGERCIQSSKKASPLLSGCCSYTWILPLLLLLPSLKCDAAVVKFSFDYDCEKLPSPELSVGDTLVLEFSPFHNVVLVPTKEAWEACDTTGSKVLAKPTQNPLVLPINSTQTLYLICTTFINHCSDLGVRAIFPIKGGDSGGGSQGASSMTDNQPSGSTSQQGAATQTAPEQNLSVGAAKLQQQAQTGPQQEATQVPEQHQSPTNGTQEQKGRQGQQRQQQGPSGGGSQQQSSPKGQQWQQSDGKGSQSQAQSGGGQQYQQQGGGGQQWQQQGAGAAPFQWWPPLPGFSSLPGFGSSSQPQAPRGGGGQRGPGQMFQQQGPGLNTDQGSEDGNPWQQQNANFPQQQGMGDGIQWQQQGSKVQQSPSNPQPTSKSPPK